MGYTRTISPLPEGTAAIRSIQAQAQGLYQVGPSGSRLEILRAAHRIAEMEMYRITEDGKNWKGTPEVATGLEKILNKAAIDPMSMSTSQVGYGPNADLVDLTKPLTILGALDGRGIRRTPLNVKVPIETSTFGGAWVPEGHTIAVLAAAYSSGSMDVFKVATSTVLSMELMRSSSPDALETIKRRVTETVAKYMDVSFCDPTYGLLAGERPAAVTFNGLFFTSTGSTSAAIEADLTGMMALLGSWDAATWILPPRLARFLWKFGAPGMGPNVMGIPAILSANCGSRIILLDAADILFADGGAEVDVSGQASLLMSTTPETSPIHSELVSLWQADLVSVRVLRLVSWLRAHGNSVVSMSISY